MFDEMLKELFDSIDYKTNNILLLAITGAKGKISQLKEMLLTVGMA